MKVHFWPGPAHKFDVNWRDALCGSYSERADGVEDHVTRDTALVDCRRCIAALAAREEG